MANNITGKFDMTNKHNNTEKKDKKQLGERTKNLYESKWNTPLKINGKELEKNINDQQKEIKIKEKIKKNKEDRRNQIDNKLYHNFLKQINTPYKIYEENHEFDYSDDDGEPQTYRNNYGCTEEYSSYFNDTLEYDNYDDDDML